MAFIISLILCSSLWANQEAVQHRVEKETSYDVSQLTRPVRILSLRKLEHYIKPSTNGQINISELAGLIVEIRHGTHLHPGPIVIQYHSDKNLFTMRSDQVLDVNVIDLRQCRNRVVSWKASKLKNASVQEIIKAFDY